MLPADQLLDLLLNLLDLLDQLLLDLLLEFLLDLLDLLLLDLDLLLFRVIMSWCHRL